jgi:uncharacterized protein YutE (UPF0331/DUF86 family)
MIDPPLVAKKLAFIETCVRELHELCQPERIGDDIRETRFAEHTLQIAIQAALDVASHVISSRRLGEPSTNRETFDLLADSGVVDPALAESLYAMAGFRNLLVHGYQEIDTTVVRQLVEDRLSDLLAFVNAIRAID